MNRSIPTHLLFALVLAGGVQSAVAASQPVAFVDCDHAATPAVVHPKEIVLACADGNANLAGLTWTGWGAPTTVATGVAVLNDCTPTCVGGTFRRYPARVKLERIRPCAGLRQYTRLTIFYVARPFPSGPRRVSDVRGCAHPA